MIKSGQTILFQGDSITDTGRFNRNAEANDPSGLGSGYAMMVAASLLAKRPADGLRFLNRGISGNRVTDLYARWVEDCVALKPDFVSILIGVNDTWRFFDSNCGVPVPKYTRVYRQLLAETREALPDVTLVLCEPFVLRCGAVTDQWLPMMKERCDAVRELAREFKAVHVPFQSMFDNALKQAPPAYWAADGVHPSAAGHMLMAQTWMDVVEGKTGNR